MARLLLLLLVFSVFLPSLLLADEPTAEGIAFFETKIRPVLAEQCYQCHSEKALAEKKLQGELLLDTRAGIRKGSANRESGMTSAIGCNRFLGEPYLNNSAHFGTTDGQRLVARGNNRRPAPCRWRGMEPLFNNSS